VPGLAKIPDSWDGSAGGLCIASDVEVNALTRRMIDCRDWPGPCTLAISGTEAEVVEAQAQHMVHVHGATDGSELREQIRVSLKDAREEALA